MTMIMVMMTSIDTNTTGRCALESKEAFEERIGETRSGACSLSKNRRSSRLLKLHHSENLASLNLHFFSCEAIPGYDTG